MTEKLRALALAATPGPWSAFVIGNTVAVDIGPTPTGSNPCIVHWMGFESCDMPKKYRKTNAAYIAEANPTNILALLDEIDKLKAENAGLRKDAERYQLVRRGQHWAVIDGIGDSLRAESLDSAVDAAIASARKQENPMVDEQKLRELVTRVSQLANLEANELAQVMDEAAAAIFDLTTALESEQQAAKTWENEADRRSKRYTKAAVELEQAQAERISLLDELQAMREERTALLATEQNLTEELAALRASLGEPVAQQEAMPMREKEELVMGWFAEDWAIRKGLDMLHDYEKLRGMK